MSAARGMSATAHSTNVGVPGNQKCDATASGKATASRTRNSVSMFHPTREAEVLGEAGEVGASVTGGSLASGEEAYSIGRGDSPPAHGMETHRPALRDVGGPSR